MTNARAPFRSRIIGTGGYAPPLVVKNDELKALVDTNDEWIQQRSGIKQRRLVDIPLPDLANQVPTREAHGGQTGTADMAEKAARLAMEQAGITAEDIDLIVVGTVTPDLPLPSCAILLQEKLGAKNAFAFDVLAACAGSAYAMSVADKFIASGAAKRALVIGGETLSSITNWQDRGTCVLFGDAAGCFILEATENTGDNNSPGVIDIDLYSDGTTWQHIWIPAGGSRQPMTEEDVRERRDRIIMNGREVYKFAVRALTEAAQKVLADNGYTADDVSLVCAHQANLRIIEAIADRTHIPLDRFVINIDQYGNTSSASLPITFDEARRNGRVKEGDLVLMMAIGAGMTWSAALYRA